MTPIVPFDPSRVAVGNLRASLQDSYSADAIRSFVAKLRQLAVLRPDHCGALLGQLDRILAGILEDITSHGSLSRPRDRQLSTRGLELFQHLDNMTSDQLSCLFAELERASKGEARPDATSESGKLSLLRRKSPEAARVIESMLDGALEALYPTGGAR